MVQQTIAERINQRRRQVLIHSILYYKFNDNVVSDTQFDAWCYELVDLQRKHPEVSESVPYMLDEFRDFSGETGFDLPLHDPRAQSHAIRLLAHHKKESREVSL